MSGTGGDEEFRPHPGDPWHPDWSAGAGDAADESAEHDESAEGGRRSRRRLFRRRDDAAPADEPATESRWGDPAEDLSTFRPSPDRLSDEAALGDDEPHTVADRALDHAAEAPRAPEGPTLDDADGIVSGDAVWFAELDEEADSGSDSRTAAQRIPIPPVGEIPPVPPDLLSDDAAAGTAIEEKSPDAGAPDEHDASAWWESEPEGRQAGTAGGSAGRVEPEPADEPEQDEPAEETGWDLPEPEVPDRDRFEPMVFPTAAESSPPVAGDEPAFEAAVFPPARPPRADDASGPEPLREWSPSDGDEPGPEPAGEDAEAAGRDEGASTEAEATDGPAEDGVRWPEGPAEDEDRHEIAGDYGVVPPEEAFEELRELSEDDDLDAWRAFAAEAGASDDAPLEPQHSSQPDADPPHAAAAEDAVVSPAEAQPDSDDGAELPAGGEPDDEESARWWQVGRRRRERRLESEIARDEIWRAEAAASFEDDDGSDAGDSAEADDGGRLPASWFSDLDRAADEVPIEAAAGAEPGSGEERQPSADPGWEEAGEEAVPVWEAEPVQDVGPPATDGTPAAADDSLEVFDLDMETFEEPQGSGEAAGAEPPAWGAVEEPQPDVPDEVFDELAVEPPGWGGADEPPGFVASQPDEIDDDDLADPESWMADEDVDPMAAALADLPTEELPLDYPELDDDRIELSEQIYSGSVTQEHRGLAEAMSLAETEETELQAVAAPMAGVESGIVGFEDVEDLGTDEEYIAPAASDLGLRVLTGAVLIVMLLGALWVGGEVLAGLIVLLMLLGLAEFYSTLRRRGYRPLALFGFLGAVSVFAVSWFHGPVGIAGGLLATTIVVYFVYALAPERRDALTNGGLTVLGVAWIAGTSAFAFPIVASAHFRQLVVAIVVTTVAMDVGAYFSGRSFGSRPLAPILSPNKTVEGLAGGVILTIGASIAMTYLPYFTQFDIRSGAALGLVVAFVAPLGDLAESMIKRSLAVKDMGTILPGHGGILDRVDAFLFVLPAAWVLYETLGLLV